MVSFYYEDAEGNVQKKMVKRKALEQAILNWIKNNLSLFKNTASSRKVRDKSTLIDKLSKKRWTVLDLPTD